MLVVMWGKKIKERPLRSVEDFCPLHRKIHLFDLFAITEHWHLNHVAFGKGTLVRHVIRGHAHGCGHISVVDPLEIERDTPRGRHSERLEVEAKLARDLNNVTSKERRYFLSEQITSVSEALNNGLSNDVISAAQKRPLGITVGVILISTILWATTGSPLFALPFIGGIMAFPFAFIRPRQKLQKAHEAAVLDAILSCGLAPLDVTQDELCEVFIWGKSQGFRISRKFRKAMLNGVTAPQESSIQIAENLSYLESGIRT